jgi:hypothetical protein
MTPRSAAPRQSTTQAAAASSMSMFINMSHSSILIASREARHRSRKVAGSRWKTLHFATPRS